LTSGLGVSALPSTLHVNHERGEAVGAVVAKVIELIVARAQRRPATAAQRPRRAARIAGDAAALARRTAARTR
jgi:hypothetical protein